MFCILSSQLNIHNTVLPRTSILSKNSVKIGDQSALNRKGKNKYETYLYIFKRYPNLEISREVANTNLDMKKVVSKCAPNVRHYTCIIYMVENSLLFLKLIWDALNLFGSAQNTALYSRDIHVYLKQWGLNFSSIKLELFTASIFLVDPLKRPKLPSWIWKTWLISPIFDKMGLDFFLHCCQCLGRHVVRPPLQFMFVEFFYSVSHLVL